MRVFLYYKSILSSSIVKQRVTHWAHLSCLEIQVQNLSCLLNKNYRNAIIKIIALLEKSQFQITLSYR
jgi:hypothetical protein